MIKIILWDVDGTLLDFIAAERAAIKSTFAKLGLGDCTDDMVSRYSEINKKYWKSLELGHLTKPQVLRRRFEEFFASEGIDFTDIDGFNAVYQVRLGDTVSFIDGSAELLASLKGRVLQYAVTNGTRTAQRQKLEKSGFIRILDGVFISDEIGAEKPSAEFFDYVFAHIPKFSKDEIMIVGDSLTGDIAGGIHAGIKTCWYNPRGESRPEGIEPNYEISNLNSVKDILLQKGL